MGKAISRVKIGPIEYGVRTATNELVDTSSHQPVCGSLSFRSGQIVLAGDLCKAAARQTLWHEVVHGILYNGGFLEQDDRLVEVVATGVMEVLQDNPALRK